MDSAKHFKKIMDKSESNKVVILTAHYKITGNVYDCEDCNKDSCVNLTDAKVCNLEETFNENYEKISHYDWLHINMDAVVAYSFI